MIPKVRRAKTRKMITLEVLANTAPSPAFRTLTLGGPELAEFEPHGRRPGRPAVLPARRAGRAADADPGPRGLDGRGAADAEEPPPVGPQLHDPAVPPRRDRHRVRPARRRRPGRRVGPSRPLGRPGRGLRPRRQLPTMRPGWPGSCSPRTRARCPRSWRSSRARPPTWSRRSSWRSPAQSDIREVEAPAGVRVHWLPRLRPGRPGALALQAVRDADLPPGRAYAWVAGETALATGVRRHLVRDRGWPKSGIAFLGYWRHGRASPG